LLENLIFSLRAALEERASKAGHISQQPAPRATFCQNQSNAINKEPPLLSLCVSMALLGIASRHFNLRKFTKETRLLCAAAARWIQKQETFIVLKNGVAQGYN
jgi:hypothetical protein